MSSSQLTFIFFRGVEPPTRMGFRGLLISFNPMVCSYPHPLKAAESWFQGCIPMKCLGKTRLKGLISMDLQIQWFIIFPMKTAIWGVHPRCKMGWFHARHHQNHGSLLNFINRGNHVTKLQATSDPGTSNQIYNPCTSIPRNDGNM